MNILVIGCDQVGAALVRDLERIGHDISIIEKDSEQLKRLDGFDEELFEHLVEKIIAESQNRIRFRLYGGLELTEQWEVAAR